MRRPDAMPAGLSPGATLASAGLGRMGMPMARHLAAAGYVVRGFDVSADARARLAAVDGAAAFDSASEAAAGADAVILMLPSSANVHEVLIAGGLLEELASPTVVIDMGSSEPLKTRALAPQAAQRGLELVDAPVWGGVTGAEAASLTVMAGGSAESFGR